MYLGHVACRLRLTAVGRVFERERSTAAHACKRVEDRREDKDFDAALQMMETSVSTIVRTSEALRRDLQLTERGGAR